MASTLRERRRQMLREEILEAARALLSEKGYATMSMEELAARVGVSKPTLYSHFGNKDDLLIAAASYLMERMISAIESERQGRTPLEHLTWTLKQIVQLQVDEGTFAVRIWLPEVLDLLHRSEETSQLMVRIDGLVLELVQEAIASGEINPQLDAPTVVRAFHALAKAPHFAPLSQSGPLDLSRVAEALATILRHGVAV